MEPGSIMLARERVLQTLLELTHGPASLTPVELGTRLLDITLALVDCDGVALTAPRHRDGIRLLRARQPAHYEPEAMTRDGSPFLRLISRMAHPLIVADLSTESRAGEEDRFPGLPPGPALFVPFGSRETALGCLAAYRRQGAAPFGREDARVLTLLATSAALALDNRRLAKDLQKLAITDDLTQVYNYRYLKTSLRRELKRAARFRQELSVIMIDVDNLKTYNDVNGHLRGSYLLKDLAGLCVEQVRSFDILAKYGGDEFTIILPQTNRQGAIVVAERVRCAVDEHAFALAPRGRITVSLGVATFPEDGQDPLGLLQAADHALYLAKRRGRNRVECVEDLAA
jgi:diguanylate cyclase (GGDEF)-like protein